VTKILESEFVWGIVLGLLLAIFVAIVTTWLNNLQRRRTVAAFCQDLIGSVCDLIQNLEDNRDRNRRIDHEFLETIAAEITVYGRNREHLVFISDALLRKDVRAFFTRVAALLAQIQGRLGQFYEANRIAQSENDPARKGQLEQIANSHLIEAHRACDRLREQQTNRENLNQRFEDFSKRFF
jgi:hypothetical protein